MYNTSKLSLSTYTNKASSTTYEWATPHVRQGRDVIGGEGQGSDVIGGDRQGSDVIGGEGQGRDVIGGEGQGRDVIGGGMSSNAIG